MPYYRGLGLSMVEAVDLTLDGNPVPPERTTFTVHGHTYTFAEMPGVTDDRWEMGERAELAFETDEPGDFLLVTLAVHQDKRRYLPVEVDDVSDRDHGPWENHDGIFGIVAGNPNRVCGKNGG